MSLPEGVTGQALMRANLKHKLPFGLAGNPENFAPSQLIFVQGAPADAIFYILEGKVRLTVISKNGKEAILAILGEGDFCGEGSLAGQARRAGSATAMTHCQLLRIDREAMSSTLQRELRVSDLFIHCLLARNVRIEQDLVDQLFNSSEKRLARVLLLLSQFGEDGVQETAIHKISQGALAEMIGTTRSRVNFFMNQFRASGFIKYGKEGIQVHHSLLNVVLKD